MANCCIILGKSGTGKSTSIKGLDPKETSVINVLGKRLPFKGSGSLYSKEKKNHFIVDDYQQLIALLQQIDASCHHVKNVILDDAIYVLRKEYFKKATVAGFQKYTELAVHFQQVINTCEKMKMDTNVFFMLHSEDVTSDNSIVTFKVSTVGKLLDSQYNIVEVVPMVLYSTVRYNDKGEAEYGFYTHRIMQGTVEIPAKSPADMFEEDFIPNDLGLVVKKINEYYNG
jgi:hypothetical protein